MADSKISALPASTVPLAGTEILPIVQSGATKQVSVQNVLSSVQPTGTANGVAYLNGSKVLTTGSALMFDGSTLAVTGGATIEGLTVGRGAGAVATNTAIGTQALQANTTASNNTAVGYQAGYSNQTGYEGVFIGYQSGKSSTGQLNTIIGSLSGFLNTSGIENCYVGAGAGYLATGSQNTFIGRGASIAAGSAMTTGSKNTIIGGYTGYQGGLDIRTTSNYIVLSDGDGNPRGVFDGSGNFLVGTTSPLDNSKLSVLGGATDHTVEFVNPASAGYAGLIIKRPNSVGAAIIFGQGGSDVGSVSLTSVATLYNTTSDYRLKTVIGAVSGAGERIDALEPVEYEWKADGSRTRGFLAHKFQEVYASSVAGIKDAVDDDGKPAYQAMQAGSSEVIADLVAEIQSLRKRLAAANI